MGNTSSTYKVHDACPFLSYLAGGGSLGIPPTAEILLGKDDHGVDFKVFGATAGSYMLWDESANELDLDGADIHLNDSDELRLGDLAAGDVVVTFDGSNFSIVPAAASEGFLIGGASNVMNTVLRGTLAIGVDDTGHDVTFYGATASHLVLWDESENTWNFGADDYGVTVNFHGATAGVHWKWDAANDRMEVDGGSNLFRAVASGDGGITVSANGMTADPETDAEAGYISILVNATGYQIPIYAAA